MLATSSTQRVYLILVAGDVVKLEPGLVQADMVMIQATAEGSSSLLVLQDSILMQSAVLLI